MTTDLLPGAVPAETPLPAGAPRGSRPARVGGDHGPGRAWPARRLRGLWRGRPEDPAWVRPALLALLGATAVLYLWDLGASGWANSFYAAAVQAGSRSWKAFFFGSSDAANFITVDKPPASLWVMELSARVFGLSAWSLLVPQALEGVATVAVLYATVRRWFRPGAALLAGAVLATTPVAALMFRYDNPDALLVLLLTTATYAVVRALERGSTGWLVLAMAAVGTGFVTKMMQAFLILPALVLVYLVSAPVPLRRRLAQLAWASVSLVVSAGWWVAAVALTPAADRPYVGGSQDNSILNLIFGYNGFGRLSGNESGSVGGAGPAGSRWGPTGLLRFFGDDFGTQIAWLLPAALVLALVCLWMWRRRPRTDRPRAAMALWTGSLLGTVLVISLAQGIIHPYYSVAAAPAVGALVGMGASSLWERRHEPGARAVLALTLAGTAAWAAVLLDRAPTWMPWLRPAVLGVGLVGALALALPPRRTGRLALAIAAVGAVGALGAPAAYALDTAATPHQGAIPSAGPTATSGPGGAGGPGFAGGGPTTGLGGGPNTAVRRGTTTTPGGRGTGPGTGSGAPGLSGSSATPGAGSPGLPGAAPGGAPAGRSGHAAPGVSGASGAPVGGSRGGGRQVAARPGGAGGSGPGGFLTISTPGRRLVADLEQDASRYTWVAAVVNSNNAAGYQLATDDPVMAIGGFNGTDPAPTLAQFERDVAEHKIHFFVAGGTANGPGAGGADDDAGQITSWVERHFPATTVDGTTIYDLGAAS